MSDRSQPGDHRGPRTLSHAAHELRTPISVVLGYLRMLLNDKASPLTDHQRNLLQQVHKSTSRLNALTNEMSDLARLESGRTTFNRCAVDLGALLEEVIRAIPPVPDREVNIILDNQATGAMVEGDPTRLRDAFHAILFALRRELVTSTVLLVRVRRVTHERAPVLWIAIAGNDRIDAVDSAPLSQLGTFNEWRGGCGLMPAIAGRIIVEHGGRVSSPSDNAESGAVASDPNAVALSEPPRASAVIVLPER
ncbi:MAG: sensor histidine kinase [Vicinamibacterales bacterium]